MYITTTIMCFRIALGLSTSTTECMCTDLGIVTMQYLHATTASCITNLIDNITNLYATIITDLIPIIIDKQLVTAVHVVPLITILGVEVI